MSASTPRAVAEDAEAAPHLPAGDGQPGSPALLGFHSTKSMSPRL